ncbi:glycosyltransferase [Iamia sp. SCSIO 61187]|uniref:glycosyltransferase n=1 Tax=Iamia sp. SCSIO 61187 TaxID=2722752 RepID=UPI001C6381C6|nr:glycosyltransferase [Iamia sp. SCSIO 61187]
MIQPPTVAPSPLRIALLASSRFPIREPFAGGLEAHTWQLATGLRRHGHHVTVFAGAGSDERLDARTFAGGEVELSAGARADVSAGPEVAMADHHAYLSTMLELAADGGRTFDVVHNSSTHHLPLAMAPALSIAQVTTLHTPPTPWMEMAIRASATPLPVRFCAVSRHTADAWRPTVPDADVVTNAVDLDQWRPGPGGDDAVWFGRIVPEKGLHLAIDATRRAGRHLRIAGPRHDPAYWDAEVAPRLGPGAEWVGHLALPELAALVGASRVAVVSPLWDEPFGLVALEALACGTPVAAIGRGGLVEVLDATCSRVVVPEAGTDALAAAIDGAGGLDRTAARRRAVEIGSVDRMVDQYVDAYRSLLAA